MQEVRDRVRVAFVASTRPKRLAAARALFIGGSLLSSLCTFACGPNDTAAGADGSGGYAGNGGGTASGATGSAGGTTTASAGGADSGGNIDTGGGAGTGGLGTGAGGAASTSGGVIDAAAGPTGGSATSSSSGGLGPDGGRARGTTGGDGSRASSGGASSEGGAGVGGGGAEDAGSGTSAGDAGIEVPAGYKLVWHDEFDVDGRPNPANWKFESGFVRNEEAQWYQSDNASVQGGMLVIEARKERVANPNYQAGSSDWKTNRQYAEYTSSSLLTSGLQSWQYGRFEMRARIPTSAGMWPAWWTLGVSGEWPSNGEIDIMEYYQGKVLANVACGTSTRWQAKWDSASKAISSLGAGWSSQFHVWRMDWDDQKIVLSLDDQQMNTTNLQDMLNADGTSPFKQKAYMLVNLAIGGNNGGDPSSTSFPQRYEIDYIRVFQKQ